MRIPEPPTVTESEPRKAWYQHEIHVFRSSFHTTATAAKRKDLDIETKYNALNDIQKGNKFRQAIAS